MNKHLSILVDEDSPESWGKLKSSMPWNFTSTGSEKIKFSQAVQLDDLTEEYIEQQIAANPEGTIWGEFYVDPIISIGEEFSPIVQMALYVSPITQVPSLSNLTSIYRSPEPWNSEMPDSAISYLLISCPRCQLIYLDGDLDQIYELDEEDWIDQDCKACGGTGEWEYELI